MAGQSWLINIVPSGNGVAFNPDVYGVDPGSPLPAQVGDLICWNNQTDTDRQILVQATTGAETFDVKAWSSSTAFQVRAQVPAAPPPPAPFQPFDIPYTCTPNGETGQIKVIA